MIISKNSAPLLIPTLVIKQQGCLLISSVFKFYLSHFFQGFQECIKMKKKIGVTKNLLRIARYG